MKPAIEPGERRVEPVKTTLQKTMIILLAVLLLAGMAGCAPGGGGQPNTTLTAMSAALAATGTAANLPEAQSDTLATAQAKATALSADVQATQTARAQSAGQAGGAQATAAAPVIAELPVYGLDGSSGHLGWVHDPLTLEITGYQQIAYGNDHQEVPAADFVLAADITWDTQYGSSACGFMFRSNGDQNEPDQYMLLISRFGNGRVLFTALVDGDIANIHDYYPRDKDKSFAWENGTTNRVVVVARGTLLEFYTNGVKIGEVLTTDPPKSMQTPAKPLAPLDSNDLQAMAAYNEQLAQYEAILAENERMVATAQKNYTEAEAVFDEGFLAMIAASESGRTVCTFSDAWLWLIDN